MTALDVFKIEVETAPTGLPNLVRNPSGMKGAWGWITPTSGVTVAASRVNTGSGGYFPVLRLSTTTSQAVVAYTEAMPITVGQWAGGVVDLARSFSSAINPDITGGHNIKVRIQWLDSTKTVLSSATQSAALSTIGPVYAPSAQAPASTVFFRFRIDLYKNANNTPDAGAAVGFRRAMLTKSATDPGTSFTFVEPITWTDVTGTGLAVTTDSPALEPGLAAGSTVGPTDGAKILAGKKIRFSGWTGGAWEQFYEGTLGDPVTNYLPREYVAFDAANNVSRLANTPKKYAVGTIDNLPYILEGAGVPWNCGTTGGNQVGSANQVASNDGASLLDQVYITRDSDNGYAAVDRFDVLQVDRRTNYSTTPVATFTDTGGGGTFSYSDIDLSKSAAAVINTVSITYLRYKGTTTKEIPYGPWVDQASVDTYGAREAEFVLQGNYAPAGLATFANSVLAANSTPGTRPLTITIPIKSDADRLMACTLKHYDTVRVSYKSVITNQDSIVTGIHHEVAPDSSKAAGIKWMLTITLAAPVTYALPKGHGRPTYRVAHVPAISSGVTEGDWQAPALLNSWTNQGSPWSTAGYQLASGYVSLQGNVAGGALNTNVFVLPPGCRPAAQKRFAVPGSGGTYAQVHIFPTGNVQVSTGTTTTYICLDNISFPADA